MKFVVFRDRKEPEAFVVTDPAHAAQVAEKVGRPAEDFEKVGEFEEMGEERVAFNEAIAKDAIEHQGFYRFVSKTYDPVATAPGTMP